MGSVGKVDNGIVSVNAYGIYKNITFPLSFQVFKPKGTLKPSDKYQTKIDLAEEIITELIDYGFQIELVLADSLYGESSQFLKILDKYNLPYIVSIRSNHGVWLPSSQKVRANKWCQFKRVFSDGKSENRYIREIIYGWKNVLNNLRLIVQPLLLFWLIYPWLDIFPNSDLLVGFNRLINAMNGFKPFYSSG